MPGSVPYTWIYPRRVTRLGCKSSRDWETGPRKCPQISRAGHGIFYSRQGNDSLQHDLGNISGVGATPAQWYGINQYLQYKLNDCWAAGMRIEWFRDDDGTRVPINAVGDGNPGNYYEITWGLNYTPCDCLMIRPELRYDWFKGNTGNGAPFDDNTKTAQFSGGFDLIYKF